MIGRKSIFCLVKGGHSKSNQKAFAGAMKSGSKGEGVH